MRRILIGTDGSEGAGRALDFAARMAAGAGAELWIVNIVDYGLTEEECLEELAREEHSRPDEVAFHHSREILAAAEARARHLGVKDVKVQSHNTDAALGLLEAAKTRQADAIVVGKRGRGRIAGLLLGSVSQKLVSLASCPVIVVP